MKSTSATVYEELAIFTAVSASSSRVASPGAPGWTIGTVDMISVEISRPLNSVMRVTAEKVLESKV